MIYRTEPLTLPSADMQRARLRTLAIAGFGLLWCIAWFYGLGTRALGEPDEGRYAEVAREMLASGDWLTPRLDGFNFFDKPALHYWGTAAAYSAFGVHAWTARLWCALTGLLAMLAVGWAGTRLYGRRSGGYAAAMLGSSLLFASAGHINTLDMGVSAFMTVGLCAFLVAQFDPAAAQRRGRLNALMWIALALAVLSKGLIGMVLPGLALAVYLLWQRDWGLLGRLSPGQGAFLLLAICGPWFIAMSMAHADFFDYFFIREHVTRFLSSVDHRNQPFWFFVPVVIGGLFPWLVLLPLGKRDWLLIDQGSSANRFLWVWAAVILLFFSASHSKLPFYILPLLPALALLLGQLAAAMPARALGQRLGVVALLGMAGMLAALLAPLGRHMHGAASAIGHAREGLAAAAALIALAALVGWIRLRRDGCDHAARSMAIHLLAFAAIAGWQLAFASAQRYTQVYSAAPVARIVAQAMDEHTEVYTVCTTLRGLPFYLRRLVTVVDASPDDLAPGFASHPQGSIATLDEFVKHWRDSNDGIAIVAEGALEPLRARGLPYRELGRLDRLVVIAR